MINYNIINANNNFSHTENVLDRIINASWRVGFPIVKPLINDLVSVAFTKIWNDIFNTFDFNLILS